MPSLEVNVLVGLGLLCLGTFFVDAPYGRFAPEKKKAIYGPLLPARLAWCIQEIPAMLAVIFCWVVLADSRHAQNPSSVVLASLFIWHYFFRSIVFPIFLTDPKPTPLLVVASAFVFCVLNGYIQGTRLFVAPESLDAKGDAWLSHWRVRIGLVLFAFGWLTNQHADHILRCLRDKPKSEDANGGGRSSSSSHSRKGEGHSSSAPSSGGSGGSGGGGRYRIPHGGMFEWTSCANYTGEIIEWAGFALAAWSLPAVGFFILTCLNLVPRALSTHRWYKKQFDNYPKNRKAVIPYLL